MIDLAWRLARPLLFTRNPESAHRTVMGALGALPRASSAALSLLTGPPPAGLAKTVAGLPLAGPIGLAAGLDKDGEAIPAWAALGFGSIEVGTVTALPQPGNPPPRLFRLVDERALVNRMGFNNHGSEALAVRLRALRESGRWPAVPVGANIGKSKVTPLDEAEQDYLTSVGRLVDVVDFFTVNVSSPNTPGLRELQRPDRLAALLGAIVPAAGDRPVFVKLAPDFEEGELESAVEVAVEAGCAGIVATNTTRTRPGTTGRLGEDGGLSGAPLWPLARQRIGQVLDVTAGRVPVIGVGGISTADQVRELIAAGCASVQIYTALIYEGPGLIAALNRELATTALAAPATGGEEER